MASSSMVALDYHLHIPPVRPLLAPYFYKKIPYSRMPETKTRSVKYTRPEWADDERIDRIKSQLSSKRLARLGSGFFTTFGSGGAHSLIPRIEGED